MKPGDLVVLKYAMDRIHLTKTPGPSREHDDDMYEGSFIAINPRVITMRLGDVGMIVATTGKSEFGSEVMVLCKGTFGWNVNSVFRVV